MPASCLLLFLGSGAAVWQDRAAGQAAGAPGESPPPQAAGEPSLREVLELLGQWQTADGGWLDPVDLDWLLSPHRGSGNAGTDPP